MLEQTATTSCGWWASTSARTVASARGASSSANVSGVALGSWMAPFTRLRRRGTGSTVTLASQLRTSATCAASCLS